MGLQARLQAELKISINIKQEVPGKVGHINNTSATHQLRRVGIKEPFENTKI
jgi:hypothetical protein